MHIHLAHMTCDWIWETIQVPENKDIWWRMFEQNVPHQPYAPGMYLFTHTALGTRHFVSLKNSTA